MKVELLHMADCPNTKVARRLVKEALRELGLCDRVSEVEVSGPTQAERLHFPGSPTIRRRASPFPVACGETTSLNNAYLGLRPEICGR